MNKFKRSLLITIISPVICISCSQMPNYRDGNDDGIDINLKNKFIDWHNLLTKENWENSNYHCNSEQQAVILYANKRGYFWNESLHKQKEPTNTILDGKEIRGQDYIKMKDALNKAIFPFNYQVYHGVEYQEDEFWDQLKEYIRQDENGKYNYNECIGKTITSYGFISTSISRREALEYCDGYVFNDPSKPWGEGKFHLPLKERVLFEINVPKNYRGAAYLANFDFVGWVNKDNQVLINKDCSFYIKKIYLENGINVFEVDLI